MRKCIFWQVNKKAVERTFVDTHLDLLTFTRSTEMREDDRQGKEELKE